MGGRHNAGTGDGDSRIRCGGNRQRGTGLADRGTAKNGFFCLTSYSYCLSKSKLADYLLIPHLKTLRNRKLRIYALRYLPRVVLLITLFSTATFSRNRTARSVTPNSSPISTASAVVNTLGRRSRRPEALVLRGVDCWGELSSVRRRSMVAAWRRSFSERVARVWTSWSLQ